jgi:hypothetical protein
MKSKTVERVAKPYEWDEKEARQSFFQNKIGSLFLRDVEESFSFYMAHSSERKKSLWESNTPQ